MGAEGFNTSHASIDNMFSYGETFSSVLFRLEYNESRVNHEYLDLIHYSKLLKVLPECLDCVEIARDSVHFQLASVRDLVVEEGRVVDVSHLLSGHRSFRVHQFARDVVGSTGHSLLSARKRSECDESESPALLRQCVSHHDSVHDGTPSDEEDSQLFTSSVVV